MFIPNFTTHQKQTTVAILPNLPGDFNDVFVFVRTPGLKPFLSLVDPYYMVCHAGRLDAVMKDFRKFTEFHELAAKMNIQNLLKLARIAKI